MSQETTTSSPISVKERFANIFIIPIFGVLCLILVVALLATVHSEYTTFAIVWLVILVVGFAALVVLKWFPKTPDEKEFHEGKFCETVEETRPIKQPINTWTNLSFLAAGLMVILIAGNTPTTPTSASTPMSDPQSMVPLFYGLIVMFLGPGSMLFHASGKKWGGWFDEMSMVVWVGYSFSYTVTRMGIIQIPFGTLAFLIVGIIAVISAVKGLRNDSTGKDQPDNTLEVIFIGLAGLWLLSEVGAMILIAFGHPLGVRRTASWFAGAIMCFIAAFVCWIPSSRQRLFLEQYIPGIDHLWCNPDSPYQGHGFWHMFAAVGALLVYLHYTTETPV